MFTKHQPQDVCKHLMMKFVLFQICQLEALSLKQRGLVKTADQEKSALKRQMEVLHVQLLSTRNKVTPCLKSPNETFYMLFSADRGHYLAVSPLLCSKLHTLWVVTSFKQVVTYFPTLNYVLYSRNVFSINKIWMHYIRHVVIASVSFTTHPHFRISPEVVGHSGTFCLL